MKTLKEALFSKKNINNPKAGDNMYNYFLTLYNNGGVTSPIIVYCKDYDKIKEAYVIFPIDDERYCKKVINNFGNFKFSKDLNDALKDSIEQHFAAISITKNSNNTTSAVHCSFFSNRYEGFNEFFKEIEILDYEFLKLDLSKEEVVEELKNNTIIPYLES